MSSSPCDSMPSPALARLCGWLPDRADLPDGLRIGLPMMAGLLIFTLLGQQAAGVNALIVAWLVGVQGRNLAYPKRASLLSLSAAICCLSSALALLSLWHPLLGSGILALIGLLYGLTSNQRKYIQLITYNAGFCFICALHLLDSGVEARMIFASSLFGAVTAVFSAVIAGPWRSQHQGEQLLGRCHQKLADWCAILAQTGPDQVNQRLALREQLDESIAVLSHWLLEMPDKPQVTHVAARLFTLLTMIETLEVISRIRLQTRNQASLADYLHSAADALATDRPVPPLPEDIHHPLLLQAEDRLRQAQQCPAPAPGWRARLSQVWPSDAESIGVQWRKAIRRQSREWHHGLRILFTLMCCEGIVILLNLPQGYWVTLTAFIVLMAAPLGQLQVRIWSRFYGTLLGSLLALSMIWFLGQGDWLYGATGLTVFLAFATYYKARYEIHVFWLTMMMVFAITLLLPSDPYIAFYRALDTMTGALLAFLAMHLFIPSWTRRWLDSYVDKWWELECQWLQAIERGEQNSPLRWQAHAALRQLSQEIGYMQLEPNTSARDLRDWQSLLWLGLRLHACLGMLARSHHAPDPVITHQFQQWHTLYRDRLNAHWCLLANRGAAPHTEGDIQRWLAGDMQQLFAWVDRQRPFDQIDP
ncbi:FUSC family protein [Ferrimonas balearica]|uniref:FUSC family protein n=1 Tax=Ferrimonas balearica TaxID=44012 RepID=UPI001C5A15CF|nr:FUSC family protein [Ferrimonas balearica]MBW3165515.1 FUSC family protein [Ferrimonas balearica]